MSKTMMDPPVNPALQPVVGGGGMMDPPVDPAEPGGGGHGGPARGSVDPALYRGGGHGGPARGPRAAPGCGGHGGPARGPVGGSAHDGREGAGDDAPKALCATSRVARPSYQPRAPSPSSRTTPTAA